MRQRSGTAIERCIGVWAVLWPDTDDMRRWCLNNFQMTGCYLSEY